MRVFFTLLVVFFAVDGLRAQELPRAETMVARVRAYAAQYRQRLPSFEVDESAVVARVENGETKASRKLDLTLREVRDASKPGEMKDSYVFRLIDGKPPKRYLNLPLFNRKAKLPYFVQGVFSNAIGFIGSGKSESCMAHRVLPGTGASTVTLELWKKPGLLPDECKDVPEEYRKTLVVERESGRVLRLTRSMSAEAARLLHDVDWVEVEYGAQKLGEESFWLPVHFKAHDAKNEGRMEAWYSNFHRYTSTVNLIDSEPLP